MIRRPPRSTLFPYTDALPICFGDALATAVEDFRTSDSIIANHYVPAVRESLEQAGQTGDGGYLEEPQPFMDYREIGFDAASDRKSTRLNSSHANISYAVFCLKKKKNNIICPM